MYTGQIFIPMKLSMPGRKGLVNIDWSNRSLAVTGCVGAGGAGVINWLGRRKSGWGWARLGWAGWELYFLVNWGAGEDECELILNWEGGKSGFLREAAACAPQPNWSRADDWSSDQSGECLADMFSLLCWFDVLLKRAISDNCEGDELNEKVRRTMERQWQKRKDAWTSDSNS